MTPFDESALAASGQAQLEPVEPSAPVRLAAVSSVDDAAASPANTNRTRRRERVVIRVYSDLKQRVQYWADRKGISANEYITDAVDAAIRRENGDYDPPTLEIARLNQLVDEMKAVSTNVANLERVVTMGFDSLIGLTRGDNYLLDEEDGELS